MGGSVRDISPQLPCAATGSQASSCGHAAPGKPAAVGMLHQASQRLRECCTRQASGCWHAAPGKPAAVGLLHQASQQ
eukprot:362571-Chlamydomonas_euryale.AAC.5